MLLIAVGEDNVEHRTQLCGIIETYLCNRQIRGKVLAYDSAEKLISALESKQLRFNIIFLDIIMGDMNGMTCARLIRQQDKLAQIIFLTNVTDYVYEGYEVNASGYLLKPISDEKIISFLDKAICQFEEAAKETIAITNGCVVKRLPKKNIIYLESRKNKIEIVLAPEGEKVTIYTTLDSFEQLHASSVWIRSHKSFLVNFQHIEQYAGDTFVLSSGTVIPISRAYKEKAKERFFALLHQ